MGGRISVPNCGDRRGNSLRCSPAPVETKSVAPTRNVTRKKQSNTTQLKGFPVSLFLQPMTSSLLQPKNLSQKHAKKENGFGLNSLLAYYAQFLAIFRVPTSTSCNRVENMNDKPRLVTFCWLMLLEPYLQTQVWCSYCLRET